MFSFQREKTIHARHRKTTRQNKSDRILNAIPMFSLAFACIACIVAAIVTFAAPAYAESTTYDGENTFHATER